MTFLERWTSRDNLWFQPNRPVFKAYLCTISIHAGDQVPTGEANAIERTYHLHSPREEDIVRPRRVIGEKPGLVRWQKTGRRGKLRPELLLWFGEKARW